MKVTILSHTPEPEKLIAAAAKLCYASADIDSLFSSLTTDKVESFIARLEALGHESPFEHVSFTFGIEGVSRALLAQITRHRIASFSVQSQRYVDKEGFDYIIPPAIEANEEAKSIFIEAMEADRAAYSKLAALLEKDALERLAADGQTGPEAEKAARKASYEDARSVLPNACDTRMVMTMNVRSLYNFFSLRCCNRAQWEIRALASEMLRLVRREAPLLFAHAGPGCVRGACPEGAMSCGKASEVRKRFSEL